MTALAVVAIALALSQTASVLLFVRYLAGRDLAEAKDRQVWANRVQAPTVAVAQSVTPEEPRTEPLYVPFDDDEAYLNR